MNNAQQLNQYPSASLVKFSVENLYNGEVSKVEEVTHVINHRQDVEFSSDAEFVAFYARHLIKAFAEKEINEGTFVNPDYSTIERRLGKVHSIEEHIVKVSNEPFDWSHAYEEDKRYNYNG